MSATNVPSGSAPPSGSRIPGFYRLTVAERRHILRLRSDLSEEDLATWERGGIDTTTADEVVENVVGVYALPLGVALNFRVNGEDVLVPMAVEEPSVIAAASNAARMVREGGGFFAEADPPVMTAQIEIVGVSDPHDARARIEAAAAELLGLAHAALPRLSARGGGARELEVRALPGRVIVHVHIDCRDAMGANMVNTVAEALAERAAELAGGRSGLRILTNLCDRRCVRVRARVPAAALVVERLHGRVAHARGRGVDRIRQAAPRYQPIVRLGEMHVDIGAFAQFSLRRHGRRFAERSGVGENRAASLVRTLLFGQLGMDQRVQALDELTMLFGFVHAVLPANW